MPNKRFPPSAKKLRKAREQGDVAKSRLATTIAHLSIGCLYLFFNRWNCDYFEIFPHNNWGLTARINEESMVVFAAETWQVLVSLTIPFFLVVFCAVFLAEVLQTGVVLRFGALSFDLRRLSISGGMKRMIGCTPEAKVPGILVEALRLTLQLTIGAAALFAVALWWLLPAVSSQLSGAGDVLAAASRIVASVAMLILVPTAAVAAISVLRSRALRRARLSMDAQEVRAELREDEGDPEVRAARAIMMRELEQSALEVQVRDAQFVAVASGGGKSGAKKRAA